MRDVFTAFDLFHAVDAVVQRLYQIKLKGLGTQNQKKKFKNQRPFFHPT